MHCIHSVAENEEAVYITHRTAHTEDLRPHSAVIGNRNLADKVWQAQPDGGSQNNT